MKLHMEYIDIKEDADNVDMAVVTQMIGGLIMCGMFFNITITDNANYIQITSGCSDIVINAVIDTVQHVDTYRLPADSVLASITIHERMLELILESDYEENNL